MVSGNVLVSVLEIPERGSKKNQYNTCNISTQPVFGTVLKCVLRGSKKIFQIIFLVQFKRMTYEVFLCRRCWTSKFGRLPLEIATLSKCEDKFVEFPVRADYFQSSLNDTDGRDCLLSLREPLLSPPPSSKLNRLSTEKRSSQNTSFVKGRGCKYIL